MPAETSMLAIPGAYALGIVPHGYYLVRMMTASGFAWSNIAPRQNWETLKTKVPAEIYNRCVRARGAHLNAMETFPLFAAAMLAGSGRVLQADLNRSALQFLGVRALYTAAYITIRGEAASYLRTGLWAWSIALPVLTLVRAAQSVDV